MALSRSILASLIWAIAILFAGALVPQTPGEQGHIALGHATLQKSQKNLDYQWNLEEAIKFGLLSVLEKENANRVTEAERQAENWTSDPDEWVTVQSFESSQMPPDEAYGHDFIFSSYGSVAFRTLREIWAVNDQLLASLNSGRLIGRCSAGNSGCGFFHTADNRFMLKNILGEEEFFFQQEEPFRRYYRHMLERSHHASPETSTLLVKYLGFFRFMVLPKGQLRETFNLPLIVMPNIFPDNIHFEWKFDLKGSLDQSRRVLARNAMIKDLELVGNAGSIDENDENNNNSDVKEDNKTVPVEALFGEGIQLREEDYEWFLSVLSADLQALAKMGRYDYSMILSIHVLADGLMPQTEHHYRQNGLLPAYCQSCTLRPPNTFFENDKMPKEPNRVYGRYLLIAMGIVDTLKPYSPLKSALAKTHRKIYKKPRVVASPANYAARFLKMVTTKYFFPVDQNGLKLLNSRKRSGGSVRRASARLLKSPKLVSPIS